MTTNSQSDSGKRQQKRQNSENEIFCSPRHWSPSSVGGWAVGRQRCGRTAGQQLARSARYRDRSTLWPVHTTTGEYRVSGVFLFF